MRVTQVHARSHSDHRRPRMRTGSRIVMLAVLAAIAAAMFAAPTIANAEETALCGSDLEKCSSPITHVHETSIGFALLLSTFATVECSALFLGDALNKGVGSPLIVKGNFSYTCESGCTATEENAPAEIEVLREGAELAVVTGEGLVHVVCGLNCRYNGVELEAHALGALEAANGKGEVTIEGAVVNKESGFLCPSTSELDVVFEPLQKTYIPNGKPPLLKTALCTTDEV